MIDVHCHIDLYKNPYVVANENEKKGISTIAVTNLPSHFEMGYIHLKSFKYIRVALGLHPLYANKHTPTEMKKFINFAKTTSYIGEIGLDFSREGINTKKKQIQSLRHVLSHINDRPRFITLHSRRAESTVLQMLDEFSIKGAVFHWYSGSLSLLKEIVEAGHYFSINPAMVQSSNGCKIIKKIPQDRLLTETDGPFVKIEGKIITSQDISLVLKYLSSLWNCSYVDVELQIKKNFNQVLLPIKQYKKGS
ncbi:MAG TPA: Qat anti-phage system TatD family nuclease QatD [Bacillus sp. (in: firmicutes)]|uniref:Qat anti-phage system TatD family nuclease QatD n=1 Tax=Bacillus litorisediminis TaxID=2922713 RepID=UPI001FB010D5|nr:Qat anti-phage system TatD family nuclease QatD [Bacillus litorisediminis]HWO75976.1 Qat anti-phage system TatD family nuclease QatD [Bacillus sp. (in: firmicutes)]